MGSRRLKDSYGGYRERLVEILRSKGIRDLAVLEAIAETPRHLFMPESVQHRAYEDAAVPIGSGQTISQPYVQALYLQALQLRPTDRVLEIGTGSGYQTALLDRLAGLVVSVERIRGLADSAREALRETGHDGVMVVVGDGTLGWSGMAPYDAILVSAAGPEIPAPLVRQLKIGGRMVLPKQESDGRQILVKVTRVSEQETTVEELGAVRFVPLIGRHGFGDSDQEINGA